MNLLNAELLRLSTTDALTGLANRRHFESELTQMWDDRRAQDLGVALIDVDNFKSFNDSAGHAAGDAALRQVAQALADALRDERDRAARYGGEEFVVLLPGVSRQDMAAMGERLRSAVSALAIEHPGQPGRVVSVSIGLAWCAASQRGGSTEDLLRDADRALYDAKDAGRNCVMLGESMRLAAQR
ncbi:MAG: GGDEF domain-containing protein [Rhodospirillales bacterium]